MWAYCALYMGSKLLYYVTILARKKADLVVGEVN